MERHGREDIPNAVADPQATSRSSRRWPIGCSRGSSTRSTSGGCCATRTGFAADPNFAGLIDTSNEYFDSNSQGAILGGVTTAVAPDWGRAVLGVATMDYGVLLPRSTDFDTYEAIFAPAYPDAGERITILAIAQMLWDRGETDGWTQHMTTYPPKNTIPHAVLMHVAVGDHQVANVMSDVEARSIGASTAELPARSDDKTPLFGIPRITSYPFKGSGGDRLLGRRQPDAAAAGDEHPDRGGADPHSFPRKTPAARQQKSDWFQPNGVLSGTPAGRCRRGSGCSSRQRRLVPPSMP